MSDSPVSIIYDSLGNPIGVILDGVTYRLQVEAKLAAGTNTIGKVNQGAPGDTAWPVNFAPAILKEVYDIGDTVIYVGSAVLGTLTSAAAWRIKRTYLVGGNPTITQWTSSTAVWDNRATETFE